MSLAVTDSLSIARQSQLSEKEEQANRLVQQGQYEQAQLLYDEVLAGRQALPGDNLRDVLVARMNIALLLGRLERHIEAKEMLEDIVKQSRDTFGIDDLDTMKAMDNLAIAHTKLGELESAKAFQEQTVPFFRLRLGDKHETTLRALVNFGITRRNEKEFDAAHQILFTVWQLTVELYGQDDPRTVAATCDLGFSYLQRAEYQHALDLKAQAVRILETQCGQCTVDTISSIYSFAGAFRESRLLDDARQLTELASLEVDALSLDEMHPERLNAIYRTAVLNVDCHWFDEAEVALVKAVTLSDRVYTGDHSMSLEIKGALMRCYLNSGNHVTAQRLAVDLLPKFKEKLGLQSDKTITTMVNLAMLYRLQGQFEEAHQVLKEAIDTVRIHFAEHRIHVQVTQEYAVLLRHMNRLDEAVGLHLETIALSEKIYGNDHVQTLLASSSLASTYEAQGQLAEAVSGMEGVLESRKQALGARHPDTTSTMADLIGLYERVDDLASAERIQLQLLKARQGLHGPHHDETLQEMEYLVGIFYKQDKKQELHQLRVQIYDVKVAKLGRLHPDTLEALRLAANSHHECGDFDRYEASVRQLISDKSEAYGPEATETLASMEDLATALQQQERFDEALDLQSKLVDIRKRTLGIENLDTLRAMSVFVQIQDDMGDLDLDEGEVQLREILAARIKVLGTDDDLRIALTLNFFAKVIAMKGDFTEARDLWRKVLAIREKHLGEDHPATEHTRSMVEAMDDEIET